MADSKTRVIIADCSGGRNAIDAPASPTFKANECVDAVNVEWWRTRVARKRNGLSAGDTMFSSGGPFTGKLSSLFRHVPGTAETNAELWGIDDASPPVVGRKAPGTSFIAPTLKDALTGNGWDVSAASLDGKLFLAYASGAPFTAPSAPTAANTGSGAYAATLRYYRVRWIRQVGGVTVLRSVVGTALSFTPSGSGTAARVTQPTPPGQGETHWELEVSYDNVNFKVLYGDGGLNAPIAIATTTGDDNTVTSAATLIDTFTSSGTWTRPSWVNSVTYLVVAGGGGGGSAAFADGNPGGGGGAGAVRTGSLSVSSATYAVTVGAGGAADTNGANSIFSTITSTGGGRGGGLNGTSAPGNGGSGGGGTHNAASGGTGTTGGHNGGADASGGNPGGGGGAGAVGGDSTGGTSGNGGAGTASSISGASVTYGGGGGGGAIFGGNAGTATGGGGAGASSNSSDNIAAASGTPGTANTGGGGGGAAFCEDMPSGTAQGTAGGAGGSGIVILSYSNVSLANAGPSNPSSLSRLHVWDGSTVRRAGLAVPNAPTATDTGSGSYAATVRYYRVRWIRQSGGLTIGQSEPSASVAFTPSGSGASARVTQPTVAGEGETHWIVEASSDNVTFYNIAVPATAIATTTFDDALAVSSYQTGVLSPATGIFTLQKSYRFLAADSGRLLGFGSTTPTDKQNRIELSAVLGSRDQGDAERVDTTTNYKIDLDENDSGDATGLYGPMYGRFYPFKERQFWELAPTGDTAAPYRQTAISKAIGSVGRRAACIGEDAQGNPALYFMSHRGVYRYGSLGLEYIGKGIEDLILGTTSTINLSAAHVIAHLLYHSEKRQVYVWFATGASDDPNTLAIFTVSTGGWARVPSGDRLANVRCATAFSRTIGATMSRDLKPYVGSAATANALYRADDPTATDDAGTAFQAYVIPKPIEPGGPGFTGSAGDGVIWAPVASGVTITATVIPDDDTSLAKTGTASLTAIGSETRGHRRLEGSALANIASVQYEIGDAAAIANAWTVDRLVVPVERGEAQSA